MLKRCALIVVLPLFCAAWVPGPDAPEWDYWSTKSMPAPYFISDQAPSIASFAEFAVRRGIDQWGAVPTAYIALSYQGLSADLIGRNGASFTDLPANDTGGIRRETALLEPWQRSFPVRFEVVLDLNRAGSGWTEDHLSKTAAHELGHCLGLGHTPIPAAVMYFQSHNNWQLHQDELDATSFLHAYPARRPIASFNADLRGAGGILRGATPQSVTFDAGRSEDPDGTIIAYRWDFGDGATLTTDQPIAQHTYTSPGNPRPSLEVVDNSGRIDRQRPLLLSLIQGPDLAAPQITITSPVATPTYITAADKVTVGGTFSDDLSAYQGHWESDRAIVPASGHFNIFLQNAATGSWSIPDIPLLPGSNRLTFYIEDFPGNVASDTIVIERTSADSGVGPVDASTVPDASAPRDAAASDAASADDASAPDAARSDTARSDTARNRDRGASPQDAAIRIDSPSAGHDAATGGDARAVGLDANADGATTHRDSALGTDAGHTDAGRTDAGRTDSTPANTPSELVGAGCSCELDPSAMGAAPLMLALLPLLLVLRSRVGRAALTFALTLPALTTCTAPPPAAEVRREALRAESETPQGWHQRHRMLWDHFHRHDPRALQLALAGTTDSDARNRRAAAEILGYLPGPATPATEERLLGLLADGDSFVREAALSALGYRGSARARAALLQQPRGEGYEGLRHRAALVALGDSEALRQLLQRRNAPRARERSEAAILLALAGKAVSAAHLQALSEDQGLTGGSVETGDPPRREPARVSHHAQLALAHLENLARVAPHLVSAEQLACAQRVRKRQRTTRRLQAGKGAPR